MNNEQYKIWLELSIFHEYYTETALPVSFRPTTKTVSILQKLNIIFRKKNRNTFSILISENFSLDDLLDESIALQFELQPFDAKFYYVSHPIIAATNAFEIKDSSVPNVWKYIELNLKEIIGNALSEIKLNITSIEKKYEYICIPKYHKTNAIINLTEERNRIRFKPIEKIVLPGISEAFRFICEEKIRLKQNNDFKIQLWESRESGERLISDCIPNPQPDQCSIIDPKNVLTTYFYY